VTGTPRFALFGERPAFAEPKPTGNLYRPSIATFLDYSRMFYRRKQYTDDGELCRMLELRLANFHAVEHAVTVTSGFWAHVLAIAALALQGRREVIAPAFGYRRTDEMIAWAGFVPHFCDVDPKTLGISVDAIKAAMNDRTALILAPHPMVNCCDASGIEEFGRQYGIPVVFDSVEAAYRTHMQRRVGGFGDAEVFSMHATKLLNSFEGGYVTTNNAHLAEQLGRMKRFGFGATDEVEDGRALNAKLNEAHAAMALASLDEVDGQIPAHRRKYDLYLAGLGMAGGLAIVEHMASQRPDYRIIVAELGEAWPLSRENTLRLLEAENVLARSYYVPLTHKVVAYPRVCPNLPVTEAIFRRFIVLPSGSHVSEDDVEKILEILGRIARHGSELKARLDTV
jgi:dTDP-4-amino-4,6-dideoxygalactose transaminase